MPPPAGALALEAAKVGMKSAGSAGLLCGALLLIANTPGRRLQAPPLSFTRLFRACACVLLAVVACGALLGAAGARGGLAWTSSDLAAILRDDLFRPHHFLCAYGIHLGAYIGGTLSTLVAMIWTRRTRAKRPEPSPSLVSKES